MNNTITGKKVILRPLQDDDAPFFAHWYNDPEVMFECGFHEPTTLEDELKYIRKTDPEAEWYAVTDMTGRLVGITGLLRMWRHWFCTDMSIIIPDPADQGKGYGGEAVRLILDRAFNHHGFNRVAIGVVGLNTPALDFYERLGFIKEGIQEQGYFHNGVFSDFVMMRILRQEYEAFVRKSKAV